MVARQRVVCSKDLRTTPDTRSNALGNRWKVLAQKRQPPLSKIASCHFQTSYHLLGFIFSHKSHLMFIARYGNRASAMLVVSGVLLSLPLTSTPACRATIVSIRMSGE